MAARKRKSPDKRRPAKTPGLASTALVSIGGVFARGISKNPKAVFGCAGFVVLFSFVAANALWYQPGDHPAPFLATRDPDHPNALTGYRTASKAHPDDVTTFRIERASDKPAGATDKPAAQPAQAAPVVTQLTSVQPASGQPSQPSPLVPQSLPSGTADADHALIAAVQRELSRRGLYEGADDGVIGSRTQSAILFFQETAGLPQTGDATVELLNALKAEPRATATAAARPAPAVLPVPKPAPIETASRGKPAPAPASLPARQVQPARPVEQVSARAEDPVAAAIRASERKPSMTPPAEIPNAAWKPGTPSTTKAVAMPSSTNLVLQIQRGLSNIAYADVEVDGVAGAQTKEAIRRFEKHYRLPETGEPNPMVLNKLKAIGAL